MIDHVAPIRSSRTRDVIATAFLGLHVGLRDE